MSKIIGGGRRQLTPREQLSESRWLDARTINPEDIGDRSWNIAYMIKEANDTLAYREIEMPVGTKFTYFPFQYEKEELEVGRMYIFPENPDDLVWGYFQATIEPDQAILN